MSTQVVGEPPAPPTRPLPAKKRLEAAGPAHYRTAFWMAFFANLLVGTGQALLFRYADFVEILGGTEEDLGFIVGTGMIGAFCMRLAQGLGIDRFGPRRVWLWSLLLLAAANAAHLTVTSLDSPAVYLLQIGIRTAFAGAFGASITYISFQVPPARAAEVIGALGASGFVGMMAGTALGDFMGAGAEITRTSINEMFLICSGMALAALFFAWRATTDPVRPPQRKLPPLVPVIKRFHPGVLLLVALAIGIGLGMPGVFIRPFAKENGITVLAWFFWTYAPTALVLRIVTRGWSTTYGARPLILVGLGSAVVGTASLIFVTKGWHFVLPALFFGISHALLYPAVTGSASTSFPTRFRGIGVALVLAMYDLGTLIGAPLGGSLHAAAGAMHLPKWTVMFSAFAGVLTAIAVIYTVISLRKKQHKPIVRTPRVAQV